MEHGLVVTFSFYDGPKMVSLKLLAMCTIESVNLSGAACSSSNQWQVALQEKRFIEVRDGHEKPSYRHKVFSTTIVSRK